MDTAEGILSAVLDFIPPSQYDNFTRTFWTFLEQPHGWNLNEGAISLLRLLSSSEILTRRLCRYWLSLGCRLSDELNFLAVACEFLQHSDYCQVQQWTYSFLRETWSWHGKARFWLLILDKVFQYELLKRWLIQLSTAVFGYTIEIYIILAELRSYMDFEILSYLLDMVIEYGDGVKQLDEGSYLYLNSVLDYHLGAKHYLKFWFLMSLTGGKILIPPQSTLLPDGLHPPKGNARNHRNPGATQSQKFPSDYSLRTLFQKLCLT